MSAQHVYTWHYIAPRETAQLFNHGYGTREAVVYSITVFGQTAPGVPYPASHATLTQGETFYHVNNTVARKIYVFNHAAFNPVRVEVHVMRESF